MGQGAYEEINRVQAAGNNYGWDIREGPGCHEPSSGCSSTGLTSPIVAAPRDSGMASIIGGFVYRGSAIPSLVGRYLFTDFYSRGLYLYDASAPNGYTVAAGQHRESRRLPLRRTIPASCTSSTTRAGTFYRINGGAGGGGSPVPTNLTDTGCVSAGNPTQPASGLIPYAPNAPFWSDGADEGALDGAAEQHEDHCQRPTAISTFPSGPC